MQEFQIETRTLEGGAVLLKVLGPIDGHSYEAFEAELDQQHLHGAFKLILDLSEVPYISSAGAGVLVGSHPRFTAAEGNLVLLNPSANVRRALAALLLDDAFPLVENLEAALASFA